jgi:hypothetical protein
MMLFSRYLKQTPGQHPHTPRPLACQTVESRRTEIPRTESNTQVVDQEGAIKYRKCFGKVIYSSIDRRDIMFEVQELARHMKEPREVDWENLPTLGR